MPYYIRDPKREHKFDNHPLGVSEHRGPQSSTLNSRILIILRKYRGGLKKWGLKPPEITPG